MPPTARYDEIHDVYDRSVGDDVGDPATAALLRLLPACAESRVLDLACGQGRLARELARRGAAVVGIDISTALIERAPRRGDPPASRDHVCARRRRATRRARG